MHSSNKSELGAFYLRQMLGLVALSILNNFIYGASAAAGGIIGVLLLVLWVISFIGAINGEKKLLPVVGQYFQDWFKFIS